MAKPLLRRVLACWGNGDSGRLGLGSLQNSELPAACSALLDQRVSAVACGGAHTVVLTGVLMRCTVSACVIMLTVLAWQMMALRTAWA